jgi:hypothetical protein
MDIEKSTVKPRDPEVIIESTPATYLGGGSKPSTYLGPNDANVEIRNLKRTKAQAGRDNGLTSELWGKERGVEQSSSLGERIEKARGGGGNTSVFGDNMTSSDIRESFVKAGADPSGEWQSKGGVQGYRSGVLESKISALRGRGVAGLHAAAESVGRGQGVIEGALRPLVDAFLRGREQGLKRGQTLVEPNVKHDEGIVH